MSPKIWSRLSVTRKSDGVVFKFRFQEAVAKEKSEVLNFLEKYYISRETFNRSAGVPYSKEATEEKLTMYDKMYEHFHIILCYEEKNSDNDSIVGVSIITLEQEGDIEKEKKRKELFLKVKSPEFKKNIHILDVIKQLYDGRKRLGLQKYYADIGLCVHPAYTGLGIATECFKLRRIICKENGVPAAGAWMTAVGSQKAAERAGWKTVFEIPFEELGRLTDCDFREAPLMCKMMTTFAET